MGCGCGLSGTKKRARKGGLRGAPCTKRKVRAWNLELNEARRNTIYVDGPSWSDSGIRYPDGRIAWDFPERVPAYVKAAARKMFRDCRGPAKG